MSEYGTILYIDRSDNARSIADIIVSDYILDINRYYVWTPTSGYVSHLNPYICGRSASIFSLETADSVVCSSYFAAAAIPLWLDSFSKSPCWKLLSSCWYQRNIFSCLVSPKKIEQLQFITKNLDSDVVQFFIFSGVAQSTSTKPPMFFFGSPVPEAWKLFEIMDEDDNGEINADEFVCLGASWGGENLRRYDETCNYMIYIYIYTYIYMIYIYIWYIYIYMIYIYIYDINIYDIYIYIWYKYIWYIYIYMIYIYIYDIYIYMYIYIFIWYIHAHIYIYIYIYTWYIYIYICISIHISHYITLYHIISHHITLYHDIYHDTSCFFDHGQSRVLLQGCLIDWMDEASRYLIISP